MKKESKKIKIVILSLILVSLFIVPVVSASLLTDIQDFFKKVFGTKSVSNEEFEKYLDEIDKNELKNYLENLDEVELERYLNSLNEDEGALYSGPSDNQAPVINEFTPSSVTSPPNEQKIFTLKTSDADGATDITKVDFLVYDSEIALAWFYYSNGKITDRYSDTKQSCTPGQAGTLSRGGITLNCAETTISSSENNLDILWALTADSSLNNKILTLGVRILDTLNNKATGSVTWNIRTSQPPPTNQAPVINGITPTAVSSQTGEQQIFTLQTSDPNGVEDILYVYIWIKDSSGNLIAFFDYKPKRGLITETSSRQSCTIGSGSITYGGTTLNCAATAKSESGNNLNISWALTADSSLNNKLLKFGARVKDASGLAQYLENIGSWNIASTCVPSTEICDNGIDDDCDGLIDSADSDCAAQPDIEIYVATTKDTYAIGEKIELA